MALMAILLLAAEIMLHPGMREQRAAHRHAQQALALLEEHRALLAQAAARRARTPESRESLLSFTTRSLEQHRLRSSGLSPNTDGSLSVSLDDVRYEHLMQWLLGVHRSPVAIAEISLVRTDTPGVVIARVTLSRAP